MNPVVIGNATRATRIYALCEFPSLNVRYIGKTVAPLHKRLAQHFVVARRPRLPVGQWLAKRRRAGQPVAIKWIETIDDSIGWAEREAYWIKFYRDAGASLLNLTDGGEGLAGHVFSQEHRRKISVSIRTGREFSCEMCGAPFWRKQHEIKRGNCRFCSRACYAASLAGVSRPVSAICTKRGVVAAAIARRARMTCKRGHPLSGENLFVTSQGSRGCKECRRLHKAKHRSKPHG